MPDTLSNILSQLPLPHRTKSAHVPDPAFILVSKSHTIDAKRYLELDLYLKKYSNDKFNLKYRFLFHGDSWVMSQVGIERFSKTCTIYEMTRWERYYQKTEEIVGADLIRDYFGLTSEDDIYDCLIQIQNRQIETARMKREQKQTETLKRLSSIFQDTPHPEDAEVWVRKRLLEDDVYMFYRDEAIFDPISGKMQLHKIGYCTGCGNEVELVSPKNGASGKCPHCKRHVEYRNSKKRAGLRHYVHIGFAEKHGDAFCIRIYRAEISYKEEYRILPVTFTEFARAVFEPSGAKYMVKERSYWGSIITLPCWELLTRISTVFINNFLMFPGYLSKLKGTFLEKYPIKQYLMKNGFQKKKKSWEAGNNLVSIILTCMQYPVVEYLFKLGFHKIVKEIDRTSHDWQGIINRRGKNSKEVLGIDLGILRQYDISTMTLEKLRCIKLCWKNHYKPTNMTFEVLQYADENGLEPYLKYTTFSKLVRYLEKQKVIINRSPLYIYKDYFRQSNSLGINLNDTRNLFPKNLMDAHDELTAKIKHIAMAENEKEFSTRVEAFNSYKFAYNGLFIRPVLTQQELIDEGKALAHCVGGYIDRVLNGSSMIFFIRRSEEPDTPYYTLELNPNSFHITQYHGYKNDRESKIPSEVVEFVNLWEETKLKKKIKKTAPRKIA